MSDVYWRSANMGNQSQFTYVLRRLSFGLGGVALLAFGLIGKNPFGLRMPLLLRVGDFLLGLVFLYGALISFPKLHRFGKELEKEMDEIEREMSSEEESQKKKWAR